MLNGSNYLLWSQFFIRFGGFIGYGSKYGGCGGWFTCMFCNHVGHTIDHCWDKHDKSTNFANNATSDSLEYSANVVTLLYVEFEKIQLSTSIATMPSLIATVAQISRYYCQHNLQFILINTFRYVFPYDK